MPSCFVAKVNGHLSEPVTTARSARQGCPLSPFLYVKVFELLLRKLEHLRGPPFEIRVGDAVIAYADDVSVMVSNASEVKTLDSIIKE